MSKDKKKTKKHNSKAEEVKGKKAGKKGERFPEAAAPGADEHATLVDVVREQTTETADGIVTGTSPDLLTDSLSKKDKKRIESLELGVMHSLQGAEHLHRMRYLNTIENGDRTVDGVKPKKAAAFARAEVSFYRVRGEKLLAENEKATAAERAKVDRQPDGKPKREPVPPVEKVNEPELDQELEAIKARVQARRAERYEALLAEGASDETAIQMSRFQALRDEDPKGMTLGEVGRKIMAAEYVGDDSPSDDDETRSAMLDREDPDLAPLEEAVAALEHEVSVVETEAGREFVAGVADEGEGLATVLGAERVAREEREAKEERARQEALDLDPKDPQLDEHGVRWSKHANPRPYIVMPDGKEKLMSRVTSWIDVLDDKSALKDWSDRCLLIGAARASANLDPDTDKVEVVSFVNELTHEYEHDVKAADKALRKGRATIEEHAAKIAEVEKAYKANLRHLAEELKERGDAHVKAQKGTDLHQVFQDFDEAALQINGLTVDDWLTHLAVDGGEQINRDRLSPADIADLRAYRSAMDEAGIVVINCEQRVVLDDDGVTGTYDRLVKYKPRNGQRVVKVIGDVKTGRIDFSTGKFATQIGAYAEGKLYTPGSGERAAHGASRTVGILIHSPAGQGVTTIYEVDLSVGKRGLALIRAVHDWRRATTEAKALRSKTESERFLVEVSRGTVD